MTSGVTMCMLFYPDRQAQLKNYYGYRITALVIGLFHDRGTEDIFDGGDSFSARKACPKMFWHSARRKLDQINRVKNVRELAVPSGNRLERLRDDRKGQLSIRINDQYRMWFQWEEGHARHVEITDYH